MGSGTSVPLPEGTWSLTHTASLPGRGFDWEVYTFKNQQVDAKVPFLVVRQATNSVRWGNTDCQSNSNSHFMVDLHGTLPSQMLNKCSRYFAYGDFEEWKKIENWTSPQPVKDHWKAAMPGLVEPARPAKSPMLLAQLTVQQFNGRGLRVEAFILPPKGVRPGKFREDALAGQMSAEHQILTAWTSIYVEAMQQSYFNKKPEPLMALAYPVDSPSLASAAPAATPAPALPAEKPPVVQAAVPPAATAAPAVIAAAPVPPKAEVAVTAPPVKPAPPAPVVVAAAPASPPPPKTEPVAPAPVKPTPAPVVQAAAPAPAVTPAPVPAPAPSVAAADAAEKQRLEQERKAIEDDKRKMAQQLEAMTQMLAKLQQENAAAVAAAAKAKEAPPEPAEAAMPSKSVTYANRKALVIGNDKYTDVSPLENAAADAEAMTKSLEAVGYKVYKHLNLDEKKFKQAVRDFRQQLKGGDEVLFFYAGHGVQLGNANYLLPIDVKGEEEDQIKDDAILLQKVLDDLEEKKTKFALAVIDACRNNPFKGKGRALGGRGLAPTSAATGQMIMFSAGSGQQALDRLGDNDKEKNGLFTRIFVKEMMKPGLSVDRVLRNVRNEVVRLAKSVGHEQTPALYDQAIGEFYFRQ